MSTSCIATEPYPRAAQSSFAFKTRDEALIHGDLHTGSVMVAADGDARVIDLKFAFFGPFGFDPARLLANLAFARLSHEARGNFAFSRAVDGASGEYWASGTRRAGCGTTTNSGVGPSSLREIAERLGVPEVIRQSTLMGSGSVTPTRGRYCRRSVIRRLPPLSTNPRPAAKRQALDVAGRNYRRVRL